MTYIKKFWPLLAAAFSALMATFQAVGREATTGYFKYEVEIFLAKPFEGGVPSLPMSDAELAHISDGVDAAMMTLLVNFLLFALAAIGFATLYAFRVARERVEQLAPTTPEGEPERACPFCAETIKKLAVVCKHCNRDLEPVGAEPTRPPGQPAPGKTQRVWGIILLSVAAFSLLVGGSNTIITIVLFVLIPGGFGLSLVMKARAARLAETSVQTVLVDQISGRTKIASFLSSKPNLYISGGALALVLLLIAGTSVASAVNETARTQAAAVLAAEEQAATDAAAAEKDALELDEAISSAETSLVDAETRYAESADWSNDIDRQGLQDAAVELQLALKTRDTDDIISANQKVRTAFNTVGTLQESQARAAAAEKAAADAAAKEAAEAIAKELANASVSQRNALRSAESYLNTMAFSYSGLIGQLEYEGYSTADATWGVDRVSVDWNVQAAKSAQSYLDTMAFSRSGLIDQLIYEGFTRDQANYGVGQTGL